MEVVVSTTSATYDDQDRMSTYGTATYAYTTSGDLLTKTDPSGVTTFDYDALGNLRSATLSDGRVIEYLIDAQNRRVGKKVNGAVVRRWLYSDQLRVVAELDGAGTLISRFVYGTRTNVPDYMIRNGVTLRIIADHLGTPRRVVNASDGTLVQRIDVDEFGNIVYDSNPGYQPFGFAGGLYDTDTGLTRFGARDYDPATGRWTAKDPIGFGGGDTNLYAYTLADPINLIDPDGLQSGSQWGVLPGTSIVYRIDWNQQPYPNMHVFWPNGKETVIGYKGRWYETHGGKPKVKPPQRYRKALRKVSKGFVKKASKMGRLGCIIGPALGLFEDLETWTRAIENGRSVDDQLREDLKDAGPMLSTPLGLIPNPYNDPWGET